MPRRQTRRPREEEAHSTPPTPNSPIQGNHGRIEAWFDGCEENIQAFLMEFNRKQVCVPRWLRYSWLRDEGFGAILANLKHQKLKAFVELSGQIYPDLVKVFFTNLLFKNNVLLTHVKGVRIEITHQVWKDVVGFKPRGVQVRKGETRSVQDFNKMDYFRTCLRDPAAATRSLHVGGLKVNERLLAMIVNKVLVPRGSSHSTLNEDDLILMYCIQHNIQVDWIFVMRDHMLKAIRLSNFRLPYVMLVSKFIEYFGVDVSDELEEASGDMHQIGTPILHKCGFTKVGNQWTAGGEVAAALHEDEAGPSAPHQEEDEAPQGEPMEIIPYNPPEDRGPAYSDFERLVLQQFHNLQMSQAAHHDYCATRFNHLDNQIHDIHDEIHGLRDQFSLFQTQNNPQDDDDQE